MPTDGSEPLRLVHHHPGRLRVRASVFDDAHEGDRHAGEVRDALTARPGIVRITHNPTSGSLLVEYDPGSVEADAVLSAIAQVAGLAGVVDEMSGRRAGTDVASAIISAARTVNSITGELTGGRADMGVFLPAALAASSVYSFLKKPRLPGWDSLAYWSWQFFLQLNQRRINVPLASIPTEKKPRP